LIIPIKSDDVLSEFSVNNYLLDLSKIDGTKVMFTPILGLLIFELLITLCTYWRLYIGWYAI